MADTVLVKNITHGLALPGTAERGVNVDHDTAECVVNVDPDTAGVHLVAGDYLYYHYGCDGVDDRGWGCGYRTLQTLCSWCGLQCTTGGNDCPVREVPSLTDIQKCLVTMGDKPESFHGSRDWIGSVEVALVLDQLYDVPCKIVHVTSGRDLKNHISELCQHFQKRGSPIMMGGDSDASSKGIFGVCRRGHMDYLLILDPHYYGRDPDHVTLAEQTMLLWRPIDSFMEDSFYNLCLPQSKPTAR